MITAALTLAARAAVDRIRCGAAGYRMEQTLPNGTRADCVSETHAIEVDFAHKWAEAVGQSLNYAAETGKRRESFWYASAGLKRKRVACAGR
jgi:hypothetical protein